MAMSGSPPANFRPDPIIIGLIQDLKNLRKEDIQRSQKKRLIFKKMAVNPNSALKHLCQISLFFPHLRSKCFTILRIYICQKGWEIPSEVLIEVKPVLLTCLEQVSVNENPYKLCKVVANVALRLSELEGGPWPELIDYIASSFNSDDEWTRELGLMMFGCFPEEIIEHLQNHFDSISSVVFRHMESTSGKLRKLACMAALNLVNLANSLRKDNEVQYLVPMMIMSINRSLEDQENREIVLSSLDNLNTVLIEQEKFFDENLKIMFMSMAAIAENQNVTPHLKAKAFRAIQEIDDLFAKEVSYALRYLPREIMEQCFLVWMDMLTLVDDVPNWHNVDDSSDSKRIKGETEAYTIGQYFLNRISILRTDQIFPFALEKIELFVAADQDWRKCLAGINTLYISSEGCSKELIKLYLERMVSLPLSILEDQDLHPRLCYAALNCLKTLCKDWAPTIQSKYHDRILPVLTKLSCHPEHHRNQMYQTTSIIHCCCKCTPENLEPFLSDIVLKVQELCQSNSLLAQVLAVSALGTVASSSQDQFTQFYDTAMKTLKDLLVRKDQATRYYFRARCLESISIIAVTGGKEKFQNDANQVLEDLCHCLGRDFSSFLKELMPVLLLSCKLDSEENYKGQSPQGIANNSLLLKEHSLAQEANTLACKLLSVFASEFEEIFFPWIMEAASTLILMLDKRIVVVTMAAAPALPKLLKASILAVAKRESEGHTVYYVKNLVDLIIPALLQAFGKVVYKAMYATLFKSLSECVQILDPFLALDHITKITDQIQKGFSAYSLRKKVRVHERKKEDPKKQTEEEQLLNEVSNCLVSMIQQYRAKFLPYLGHRNLNLLIKNLWDDGCTSKEKKIALSIFRNVVQKCHEDAHQYYDMYILPLLIACMDNNPEVRQEAALGIVACVEFGNSKFKDIARGAMDFLPRVIRSLKQLSLENENAYDITVSLLKEVYESHGASLVAREGHISDVSETSHLL